MGEEAAGAVKWRAQVQASLGPLELDVALEGESGTLALVGPNGSGKTTLLRLLAGALRPERGLIEVGTSVLFSSELGLDLPSERRRIGYVPQGFGLFGHLSVLDNVAFGLSTGPRRRPRRERRTIARDMLARVGGAELAHRDPGELSGGERQRVALARALVSEPELLLLDEPLAALDIAARRSVRAFLAAHLASLGRPCIVVTHDVRDVAALADRICVLEHGQVVQAGDLASLRSDPHDAFVEEFVGVG